MGKHDVPEDPQQGAPEWIVTFSDMISLLVTFFVMLMSFSTMEENEAAVIRGAFGQNTGGILESSGGNAAASPEHDRLVATHPLRGAERPHARPAEELADNIDEMGQAMTAEHVELDLTAVQDGLLIQFGDECGFAPGSDEPNEKLRRSLRELGEVLSHYSHLVVIEGHTDDHVAPTPNNPDETALSLSRAVASAKILMEGRDMSRDVVQISGLGSSRPLAPNDTAVGRAKNRRVDVRILALSKARAAALQAEFQARQAAEGR
ncbi:MAG: flagellar motor protein MotB [Planctomycetota bacterium]|nr:flagellar motor protein MotB [Planctomycetota bacterium]